MKKCYLISIGCRTNQEEILSLMSELRARGAAIVNDVAAADVVIVNTCSVTSHTESKTRRHIHSISRDAPRARILVTGCFAQQHGAGLLEYPNVEWVVGNGDKRRIAEIIDLPGGIYSSDISGADVDFWDVAVPDPSEYGRTRFSIKIQEGCDYRCAYCIVPSLRGPSRCAPKDKLIEIFKSSIGKGYKEIVLTGTHIGQYRDADVSAGEYNLESLLVDFLETPGDYRVRLSSLDPRDLTDSLITIVGENERVCDHLHVSVQSLCAPVLARMGRPCGDLDALAGRLRGFREKYPHAGLGGDFIVGHPGETDEMFEETLRAACAIGFTYGHVFRFSARSGTESSKMRDRVAESVKKLRGETLRDLLRKNRENFLSAQTGSKLYIIIENENPIRGVGGNYIKVEVPGKRADPNTFARVLLTGDVRDGYCIGELIC